jgi:hypothetical protein
MLIGFVGDDALFQFALAGASFRRQDMAGRCVMTHYLAGAGFLETFRRTLMGLHLGHILSWEFVRMAMESPVMNYSIKCNTGAGLLENPALFLEAAEAADIGYAERE